MARTSLAPGFRFHPTDVELVMYYLKRKLMGKNFMFEAISELNIYKYSPWDLPDKSSLRSKDLEWFFFCPREKKYACGARTNRATESGYWKTTGKDREVSYEHKIVGMVKTLVFHIGHPPHGERTDWVMHEYRYVDADLPDAFVLDAYVLCKVFQKSGPGPKNGAHYGAPFKEEDWDDDVHIYAASSAVAGPSTAAVTPIAPQVPCNGSLSEPGRPTVGLFSNDICLFVHNGDDDAAAVANFPVGSNGNASRARGCDCNASVALGSDPDASIARGSDGNNDIHSMLAMFSEDSLPPAWNGNVEEVNCSNCDNAVDSAPFLDETEIFSGLADLSNLGDLNESELNSSSFQEPGHAAYRRLLCDNVAGFVEMDDLEY